MTTVTVVGAGQSGLMLAIGLLDQGYGVTLVSNRTADEIHDGRVLTSQCIFGPALQIERDMGLAFWDQETPKLGSFNMIIGGPDGAKAIDWSSPMSGHANSLDQRIKMPGWMAEFEKRGGELVIEEAGVAELEAYAARSDLVVLASGKGEVGRLFERDASRSPFDKPMRNLHMTYVRNMKPREDFNHVLINIVPTVGEYVTYPALTTSGTCDIMTFEAVPGGPMDHWESISSASEQLDSARRMVRDFFPWEAWRVEDVELTDDNCILRGRLAPTVRKPVATLPSGAIVLGLADTVVLNDPITGQGSNNAIKGARIYLDAIFERGPGPFDAAWMERTFETYWAYAEWATRFSNDLLVPPAPHIIRLIEAAAASPGVARKMADAFGRPETLTPWFFDPDEADKFIAANA